MVLRPAATTAAQYHLIKILPISTTITLESILREMFNRARNSDEKLCQMSKHIATPGFDPGSSGLHSMNMSPARFRCAMLLASI